MKLSEIKGEHAIEVIADLVEPIANIASDPKCSDMFKLDKKGDESARAAAIRGVKSKTPALLKNHKKDIAAIVATLNNRKPDEITLLEMVKGIADMLNDPALVGLFTSAAPDTETTPR